MSNTIKLLIQIIVVLLLSIVVAGGMVYMKNLDTKAVEETFKGNQGFPFETLPSGRF